MYAYAYRAPYCGALSFLPVFDYCGHHPIARRTFKRALVVIRLVRLDSRYPHLRAAPGALGIFAYLWTRNEKRHAHEPPSCCCRRERK